MITFIWDGNFVVTLKIKYTPTSSPISGKLLYRNKSISIYRSSAMVEKKKENNLKDHQKCNGT